MCALTQGLTLSHRTERRLCGETVRKLIITLQKVAAQSTCSNARSILSVVRRVLLRYYSAWQRGLLCPIPIQGSSSPPGPISSESAHGRDKTWTWWRSHPVTAVLETQGTIKCATSNVIAGSWPITAQRSEPGDHWHAALPVRSWNHGLDQCNVSVGVPRTNSPVIAPPSTLRTPKERSSISSHVVLICT